MIAGDESHKRVWGGIRCGRTPRRWDLPQRLFPSRPGNPDEDGDWYPLGWLDTTRSQAVLSFQEHSCADTYAEIRARTGWRSAATNGSPHPRLAFSCGVGLRITTSPVVTTRRPWGAIRKKWGDPTTDALTV
jgi:hypothetical protein